MRKKHSTPGKTPPLDLHKLSQWLIIMFIILVGAQIQNLGGKQQNLNPGLNPSIKDDFKYVLSLQSSEAGISNFVVRYVEEPIVWAELLKELEKRFAVLNDKELANTKLSECKQKQNESASLFCERINALANTTDRGQLNTDT